MFLKGFKTGACDVHLKTLVCIMICRGLLIQKHHLTYELGLVTKGILLYKDTNWLDLLGKNAICILKGPKD